MITHMKEKKELKKMKEHYKVIISSIKCSAPSLEEELSSVASDLAADITEVQSKLCKGMPWRLL